MSSSRSCPTSPARLNRPRHAPALARAQPCRTRPNSSFALLHSHTLHAVAQALRLSLWLPYAFRLRYRRSSLSSSSATWQCTPRTSAPTRAASLFIGQVAADGDALGAARATLVGNAEPVPEPGTRRRPRDLPRPATKTAATGSTSPTSTSSASNQSTFTTSAASASWVGSPPKTMQAPHPDPLAEAASGHPLPHER